FRRDAGLREHVPDRNLKESADHSEREDEHHVEGRMDVSRGVAFRSDDRVAFDRHGQRSRNAAWSARTASSTRSEGTRNVSAWGLERRAAIRTPAFSSAPSALAASRAESPRPTNETNAALASILRFHSPPGPRKRWKSRFSASPSAA